MAVTVKINSNEITIKELFCTLLKHFNNEHTNMLEVLRSLANELKNENLSLTEMIDVGCLLRIIELIVDEIRKDVKAHKEMIGKVTCYQLSLQDKTSHKGTLATGTIKVEHYSSIPNPDRDPEGFKNVCKWFGIDVGNSPNGSVRLHWPTIKNHITKCIEEGEELPPELSDVKSDLGMTYRRLVNKE